MNTFIKKIITIIILFSTIFLFGSCNKKSNEINKNNVDNKNTEEVISFNAYDSAKSSYDYMMEAYNLMNEYSSVIANVELYTVTRTTYDLNSFSDLTKLPQQELAYGIASFYVPNGEWNNILKDDILKYGTDEYFNKVIKENYSVFTALSLIVDYSYSNNGKFDLINKSLNNTKKFLKDIVVNEPYYPFYQDLKELYFNLIKHYENIRYYYEYNGVYNSYKEDINRKKKSCEDSIAKISFEFGE